MKPLILKSVQNYVLKFNLRICFLKDFQIMLNIHMSGENAMLFFKKMGCFETCFFFKKNNDDTLFQF